MLSTGPVGLYPTREELASGVSEFKRLGYAIVELDALRWRDGSDLFEALASALDFPDYFGHNWDALEEVVSDISSGELCWPEAATGLMVAIADLDGFATLDRQGTEVLVRIFADASRRASLFGNRFTLLLHVSRPLGEALTGSTQASVAVWQ